LKLVQRKSQVLFKGEIITKMKKRGGVIKNLLQSHWAKFNQARHKSSWGNRIRMG
jgi:hypothetical protein